MAESLTLQSQSIAQRIKSLGYDCTGKMLRHKLLGCSKLGEEHKGEDSAGAETHPRACIYAYPTIDDKSLSIGCLLRAKEELHRDKGTGIFILGEQKKSETKEQKTIERHNWIPSDCGVTACGAFG